MKDTIYIMGHKNPDSDSICSALAYGEYKNKTQDIKAIPVRLGEINKETQFILDYFKIEPPELMETVRLSVEDLNFDKIAPVSPDISLGMGLNLMNRNSVNSLPVINDKEQLIGVVTLSDIMQNHIDVWDNRILGKSNTSVENIIDTLSGSPIVIPKDKKGFSGKILVLAMDKGVLGEYIEDRDIVICGNRVEIQRLALNKNISLMIITGKGDIEEEIYDLAKEKDIAVISTPYDTFTTSRLITQSIPVEYVMTKENLISFSLDEIVDDVRMKMSQTRYRAYPVVDNKNKVIGSISRYHLISSMKKKVILVDHNERSQSIDGLEEAEILEIIDHHRVADVFTGSPIYFRNEPVGSTCTIIASIFFENGIRPSKQIAGILAAGIISDTLLFKSPTATQTDKIILNRLAKIVDIDMEEFAMKMFKAGTSLEDSSPKEILNQDFKEFTIDENRIGISQVYTMDAESLKEIKNKLIDLMEEQARENKYSLFILMLTDIYNEGSEMVVAGENKELIAKAFDAKMEDSSFYVKGVLSRKKQVVPPITEVISNLMEI